MISMICFDTRVIHSQDMQAGAQNNSTDDSPSTASTIYHPLHVPFLLSPKLTVTRTVKSTALLLANFSLANFSQTVVGD